MVAPAESLQLQLPVNTVLNARSRDQHEPLKRIGTEEHEPKGIRTQAGADTLKRNAFRDAPGRKLRADSLTQMLGPWVRLAPGPPWLRREARGRFQSLPAR